MIRLQGPECGCHPPMPPNPCCPPGGVQTGVTVTRPTNYETLKNLPTINGVELVGDLTTDDLHLTIEGADKKYVHNQPSASDEWNVVHNLGKYPSVTVVDSANNVVVGDVTYLSTNVVTIKFMAPFSGKAYFN